MSKPPAASPEANPRLRNHALARFHLRHGEKVAAGVLLIFVAVFSAELAGTSVGSLDDPGPAMWPTVTLVAAAVLCVTVMFTGKQAPELWRPPYLTQLLVYGAAILLMPLIYSYAGFFVSSVMVMSTTMWVTKSLDLKTIVAVSITSSILVFLLFTRVLSLPLEAI